ncbi:hypothetical protein ACP4OV_023563 [Aristida adscensionis]
MVSTAARAGGGAAATRTRRENRLRGTLCVHLLPACSCFTRAAAVRADYDVLCRPHGHSHPPLRRGRRLSKPPRRHSLDPPAMRVATL